MNGYLNQRISRTEINKRYINSLNVDLSPAPFRESHIGREHLYTALFYDRLVK
jgi:hypothetical protein